SKNKPDAPANKAVAGPEKSEVAAKKADTEGKLHDLRAQLDALAAQQRELEGERSDASKALRAADNNVGHATRSLHDTEAAIAAQQAKLAQLESEQSTLRENLSGQRAELAALMRSAYALGNNEQLKLLLAQDRVVDLGRAIAYHRYFEQDRMRRIDALTEQLRTLADVSKQVDAQRVVLAASHQEQLARLATVQAQRGERGKLVADLEARYHDSAEHMSALGRDAGALEDLVKKLTVVMARTPPPQPAHRNSTLKSVAPQAITPFTGPGGHFPWPLEGSIIAGYGGTSSGLLIAGSAGAEVHAVADGRVAFANWLKGYGLIVIVDHGNGLMSLYANNDALLKNAGDSVHAGEAISTVGSSGGQGHNALYFEIRQGGKTVDPRAWLRRR
ncbi:MAG TPA: peptidoglycan DD-metalloendopeptidase family protein, partial [Xanthomonadaceae bacterium]|nr:peptidoglycan DD-metalloendopeptidase family protein [Xanthomonadaceae bacterium]